MGKKKIHNKRCLACGLSAAMMLAFAIVIPVTAQQPQTQQKQGGLQHEAAPGLPASCTTAVYTQAGGNEILTGKTYTSVKSDVIESAVFVKNHGWLTLKSPKIMKKGNEGGDYGGQAVEVAGGGVVNILDGEIYTDTNYGNALWATNEGSLIYMKGGSITTTASGGHGVDVTKRGTVILYDVKISTKGSGAAGALVNDSGDGNIYATRVTASTKGPGSSGFYMIGDKSILVMVDTTLVAETSEGGVLIYGSIVDMTNSNISGAKAGIKVAGGTLTITGGSVTATAGDAFYVGGGEGGVPGDDQTGASGEGAMPGGSQSGSPGGAPSAGGQGGMPGAETSGGLLAGVPGVEEIASDIIINNGTKISCTGNLINVAASTKGTFTATGTELKGNVVVGEKSDFKVALKDSTLTGAVDGAGITLDKDSKWNVTKDSVLTGLSDTEGISGASITNIIGNGHTVLYDKELDDNSALGGKTYNLSGGGKLTPKR